MTSGGNDSKAKDALFAWVEARCPHPPGKVLDAGTGRHSLSFLRSLEPASVTAVTADPGLCRELADAFGIRPGRADRFLVGSLASKPFLAGERFDVVLADYLIGAVERSEPYRQDEVLGRLVDLLAPTGRLYLVGWQPFPLSPAATPGARLVLEMARLRDAARGLAGLLTYREYPETWVQARLEARCLEVVDRVRYTNVFSLPFFESLAAAARHATARMEDRALRRAVEQSVDRVLAEAGRSDEVRAGVRLGWDYVLEARLRTAGGAAPTL